MSEPTWQQEAEFWQAQHRRLVDQISAVIENNDPHPRGTLRGIRYDATGALPPSPMQRARIRKLLESRLDTEPTEQ
jgi:hypothetical protein